MYDTNWYNRGQVVPDQVSPASDAVPLVDNVVSTAGISNEYSRGDHLHPLQISSVLPAKDTATGQVGEANTYARSDHSRHENLSIDVPLKDSGTGTAGTSNIYASATHQHPLNVGPTVAIVSLVNANAAANATKFIKTGGLGTEILCANGDATTIDSKLSRTYNGSAGGWIRLCVFPAESAGTITIVVSDKSTYFTNRITEILTQDVVTGVSSGTAISINYYYGYVGFMQNTLQVNPTDRTKSSYNNGTRMGNFSNESEIYLACSNTAINTVQAAQWEISKTSEKALTINPSSLRQADHSVGLSSSDLFAGIKCGAVQINPNGNNFNEGIRISRSTVSNYSGIYLGCNPSQTSGSLTDQWSIVNTITGELRIGVGDQCLNDNQGLMISADGNTLSFNGSIIAGTGATNEANSGSVEYSAGNPILWGVNSVETEGGFYSNGINIFQRAHPLTQGSVPP
ncbi:MAG: hypothetical protein EZS28_024937 [Streblomastix strix]|uniref:Uncharacterized protein n=1 Tax=Streblomastix strix TaxID=222440 RepID=A0A5J4VAB0_9EUKA|nr:MAG: hypothetical protein EZS28_024937 [Streblomastix strix]